MQSSISDLLIEAATLMVVGMTVVFVFLAILIGAIHFIAFINRKLPAEAIVTHKITRNSASAVKAGNTTNSEAGAVKAAITAAVHQYRKSR